MEGDSIRVTRSVVLPPDEIELRFSRSSGPGGQHANTSETRVEARFDVEGSRALTDAQKRRVVGKAGPVLRAVAQDERSQLRNRELAIARLVEQLREALKVERRRVPTRPSRSGPQAQAGAEEAAGGDEEAPPPAALAASYFSQAFTFAAFALTHCSAAFSGFIFLPAIRLAT